MKPVVIIETYIGDVSGRQCETVVAGCVNLDEVCIAKNYTWKGGDATELTMRNGTTIRVKGTISALFPDWRYPRDAT